MRARLVKAIVSLSLMLFCIPRMAMPQTAGGQVLAQWVEGYDPDTKKPFMAVLLRDADGLFTYRDDVGQDETDYTFHVHDIKSIKYGSSGGVIEGASSIIELDAPDGDSEGFNRIVWDGKKQDGDDNYDQNLQLNFPAGSVSFQEVLKLLEDLTGKRGHPTTFAGLCRVEFDARCRFLILVISKEELRKP